MFRAALKHDVKLTTNIRASTAQYGTKVYLVPRQYLSSINTLACLSHHDRDCQPRTEGIAGHAKARPFCAYARSRTASSRPEDAKDVSVPKPPLSIVFTDIVKSTTIWEKDADTMAQAMTIHDDLVRELINAHRHRCEHSSAWSARPARWPFWRQPTLVCRDRWAEPILGSATTATSAKSWQY